MKFSVSFLFLFFKKRLREIAAMTGHFMLFNSLAPRIRGGER
jgi:hypothetical protein